MGTKEYPKRPFSQVWWKMMEGRVYASPEYEAAFNKFLNEEQPETATKRQIVRFKRELQRRTRRATREEIRMWNEEKEKGGI